MAADSLHLLNIGEIMSESLILVVDDEQDIRDLLVFNLKREGYATLEAADGCTALELARSRRPALILLDVMLPRMDGLAVCRELGKDRSTEHIPIIMLTARGDDVDRIVGFELGADAYVAKPFNTRELMLRIRAMLRRRSAQTGADRRRCRRDASPIGDGSQNLPQIIQRRRQGRRGILDIGSNGGIQDPDRAGGRAAQHKHKGCAPKQGSGGFLLHEILYYCLSVGYARTFLHSPPDAFIIA